MSRDISLACMRRGGRSHSRVEAPSPAHTPEGGSDDEGVRATGTPHDAPRSIKRRSTSAPPQNEFRPRTGDGRTTNGGTAGGEHAARLESARCGVTLAGGAAVWPDHVGARSTCRRTHGAAAGSTEGTVADQGAAPSVVSSTARLCCDAVGEPGSGVRSCICVF
jgi:hypothetical protein